MSAHLLMLLSLVVILVSALLLIRAGLRIRRRGETPHCRFCDYNLTGIESDRCPECGSELGPGGVARGERYRRPRLAVVGVVLVLLSAAPLLNPVRQYDWYRLRPTAWVLSDLQSANAPLASKACKELQRRESLGKLSAAQFDTLITICLDEQVRSPGGPLHQAMIDYLGDAYLAGGLSPTQAARFFEQMFDFRLEFRRGVAVGHKVRVNLVERRHGPSWSYPTPLWAETGHQGLVVDGEQTDVLRSSGSGGISSSSGGETGSWFTCDEVGEHTATITVEVRIYSGPLCEEARALHDKS